VPSHRFRVGGKFNASIVNSLYNHGLPNGPATGDLRVIRSGCFMDMNAFMMSSHRGYLAPTQDLKNQGFRVVIDGR
jgi:formylglycine-generating enzyme required for sulfatase activity